MFTGFNRSVEEPCTLYARLLQATCLEFRSPINGPLLSFVVPGGSSKMLQMIKKFTILTWSIVTG